MQKFVRFVQENVVIVVVTVVILLLSTIWFCCCGKKKKRQQESVPPQEVKPKVEDVQKIRQKVADVENEGKIEIAKVVVAESKTVEQKQDEAPVEIKPAAEAVVVVAVKSEQEKQHEQFLCKESESFIQDSVSDFAIQQTNSTIYNIPCMALHMGSFQTSHQLVNSDSKAITTVPSLIGRPKIDAMKMDAQARNKVFIGDEVRKMRGVMSFENVISYDKAMKKAELELFLQRVCASWPEEKHQTPVLISEPSSTSENVMHNRKLIASYLLEQEMVQSVCFVPSSVLTLFAAGKTSGLVVECGDSVTRSVAIVEGTAIRPTTRTLSIAGRELTSILCRSIVSETGRLFATSSEVDIVNTMKERVCYVALPNATHVKQFNQYEPHIYQLPDGTNVKIDKARFEIPELLFNPDYNADLFSNDSQQLGVHHLAYQSIQHVDDLAFRNGLYKNIVLAGGTSKLQNFAKRFASEFKNLLLQNKNYQTDCKIWQPFDKNEPVLFGAGLFAKYTDLYGCSVNATSYLENGEHIFYRAFL